MILVIELFLCTENRPEKLIEPINRINLEHPLEHVCYEELRPLLFSSGPTEQTNTETAGRP